MVVNKQIIGMLASLGLPAYEAKAYAALVAAQPATAYELAKAAGLPTSKVYQTLDKLVDKGLAVPLAEGRQRGRRFAAQDPDEFLASKRHEVSETSARLGPLLKSLGPAGDVGHIWPLSSRDQVMSRVKRLISTAEGSILVSLWAEEFSLLKNDLSLAAEREVKLAIVHFGKPERAIGATFHHPVEQAIYQEKGGRGLTMVVDGQEAVMATFLKDGGVTGAWSVNRAFVSATEDYIRHDVYITKVTALLGDQMRVVFGEKYERLRDVFLSAGEV